MKPMPFADSSSSTWPSLRITAEAVGWLIMLFLRVVIADGANEGTQRGPVSVPARGAPCRIPALVRAVNQLTLENQKVRDAHASKGDVVPFPPGRKPHHRDR